VFKSNIGWKPFMIDPGRRRAARRFLIWRKGYRSQKGAFSKGGSDER
jgi:hypothetical protein